MPAKNRRTDSIVAWVTTNPGKLGRELGAALGFDHSSGLLSYLVKQRIVFVAGPRHWQRYYATFDLAVANHERIEADARVAREHKKMVTARESSLRSRARNLPNVKRILNMPGSASTGHVPLGKGVTILPTVKVTVALTPRERFAPEPGFERAITNDWMLRRQGVAA